MDTTDVISYINSNNLVGIRGGSKPREFLYIWMVVVANRIFVRSWGLSERSWYTAFLEEGTGAIKCGETEVAVRGIIPADIAVLGPKINEAYLQKYTSEHNRPYANGIVQPAHMAKTLELVPLAAGNIKAKQ
ncbi:DUF2255 family protein [Cesiribacter sp. SM1]|uniref:DUF2255 family protein n=1 Tax=Cesiribacter sp. SM1 TaxID=2861196 RepID=UPI001CD7362D|nr:DUF2255 family protein [Cesiribacter sp. SM1]